MNDLVAKALVLVHRVLREHPAMHRMMTALVSRFIGEKRVKAAILRLARPGDCVWDVGANVGFYTRQLLRRVGETGHVVAFDPVPANAERLRAMAPGQPLTVLEAALAASDGHMPLVVSGASGDTSHIGESPDAVVVPVSRGDSLVAKGVTRPDLLKIDVEGFEGEVLDGSPGVLRGARSVVIEIHFAALARRGRPREPIRIVNLLREHGFAVRWIDPSHVVATR